MNSTIKNKKTVVVHFSDKPPEVQLLIHWAFAYQQARRGDVWIQAAVDRDRFQRRIQSLSLIIEPILNMEHRRQIWQSRSCFH